MAIEAKAAKSGNTAFSQFIRPIGIHRAWGAGGPRANPGALRVAGNKPGIYAYKQWCGSGSSARL